MQPSIKLVFNGKTYTYIRSKTKDFGYCSGPNAKHQIIGVRHNLKGFTELDTNIHEMLHACDWSKSEEWIRKSATEIAKALWELGYRKVNDPTERRIKRKKKGK